jgi:hypothetical protein
VWRLGLEAQDIAVGKVISNRSQAALEARFVGKLEVLAAAEVSYGLWNISSQAVGGGDCGHFRKTQRRSKLSQAVICLYELVASAVGIRIGLLAHTTFRGIRVLILKHPARLDRQIPKSVVRGLGLGLNLAKVEISAK